MLVGGRRHDHNEKIKLEKENSNDVCLEEVSLRYMCVSVYSYIQRYSILDLVEVVGLG